MKSPVFFAVSLLTLAIGSAEAGAQAPAQVYRVGLLSVGADPTDQSPFGAGLIRGFARQGFVLGKNLEFERRAAHGQLDRLPQLVDELVASKVAVIVTGGYPAALAAKQHSSLPVVAVQAGDPVADGLAASFARPGGHVTGLSEVAAELSAKRLALLKEAVPGVHRVAMLWNADDLGMSLRYKAAEAQARQPRRRSRIARRARARRVSTTAFAAMTQPPAGRDPDGQRRADDLESQTGDRFRRRT